MIVASVDANSKHFWAMILAYHLSRLTNKKFQCEKREIEDGFPDEQLFCVEVKEPWYESLVRSHEFQVIVAFYVK